jgi:hypothetical protein
VITLAKRTGTQQEFSSAKLEKSMERAGVDKAVAHEIAVRLKPTEEETTRSLRSRVSIELRSKSADAARKYVVTRRLEARQSKDVGRERAQIHPETLQHFRLKPNATVTAENNGRTLELQVEESTQAKHRQVRLNPQTATELGAADLSRVAFRLR